MKLMNKVFAGLVATGIGLATTAAFAGDIRVGITMRMVSENGQAYGQMVMDEIKAINDAGGINGNMIKATLMNDECKSDKGVANANKLIFQENIHLLIGSTCSSESLPIVDVTAKAGVPQMIPHSTNSKITQKGSEWVFRIPVSGRYYGGVNAKYVGENIGTKIAYICAADAASVGDCANMEKQMRARFGVDPAYRADVQEKEVDFRSHMQKIKSMNVDGILVAALAELWLEHSYNPMKQALVRMCAVLVRLQLLTRQFRRLQVMLLRVCSSQLPMLLPTIAQSLNCLTR